MKRHQAGPNNARKGHGNLFFIQKKKKNLGEALHGEESDMPGVPLQKLNDFHLKFDALLQRE